MTKRENLRIRDPFIFVRDNKYYLLGTTGTDPWIKGSDLILYESEDLENFREKCAMVKKEYLEGYTNIWAPELHEYKGKYYLIFSVFKEEKGRGSIIFVSDDLNGNFKPLTGEYVTPQNWGCLDATLFIFGGDTLRSFSFTIVWGVVVGTYSSIYVSGVFLNLFDLRKAQEEKVINPFGNVE